MINASSLRSVLADAAFTELLTPWQCPAPFGAGERYVLEELVGAGRRSLVYRATDTALSSRGFDAKVAIKVAPPNEHSEAEALTARRVVHPNALQVLDKGVDKSGANYVVLEYVDGGDLAGKPGPWPKRVAARFIAKLSDAVQAAHSEGVVHCDLKPENVLLTRAGEPKLADFDLAVGSSDVDAVHRGNLAFMSREQFNHEPNALSPSSDIYALGGLLIWLIGGKLPHGATAEEIVGFHRRAGDVPVATGDGDLDHICRRALAQSRADRYATAEALARDLDRWLEFRPIESNRPNLLRRMSLWVRRRPALAVTCAAAIALTLVVTIGGYVWRAREHERELRAQQQVVEGTRQGIEEVRATLRQTIRFVVASMGSTDRNWTHRIPVALAWVEWLRGPAVASVVGTIPAPKESIEKLNDVISNAEARGESGFTDVMMARLAVSHMLLSDERPLEALRHLATMRDVWLPKLDQNDPIRDAVDALASCAEVLSSRPASSEDIERLRSIEAHLRQSGCNETARSMVQRTIDTLEQPQAR